MKILLASDGTPSSDRAIARVAELTPSGPREVVLLHVRVHQPEPVLAANADGLSWVPGPDERDMETHLAYACTQLARQNLSARAVLVRGSDPLQRIMQVADAEAVDLIVVGTRHLGLLGRLFLGSISKGLAAQGRFPLLIIP
ncbi:MAG: UspA [Cyanobacteria bacterium RYN_339]|nr:UspA [Cyanobacteria bacterium RYN_339]